MRHYWKEKSCSQQHRAIAACWLYGVLLVAAAPARSCPSTKLTVAVPEQCQQLTRVCVDHSVYVLYGNRHNPRHAQFEGLPSVQLKNVSMNYHGFGDEWGTEFQHPVPILRPASPGEEARDLSHPQFSRCTMPLVIYTHNLYKFGDFFINTVAPLYMMQVNQTLDRRLTLVVDTLGMQLQPFHKFLLSPLSAFRVTTLSHLSSRLPLASTETYNPDGQHVRCFRRLLICTMHEAGGSGAIQLVRTAPMHHPLWNTAQAIFAYYKRRLPPIDPSFADKSKLKVLIAALPRSDNIRAIINQEQVWSWCKKFTPPAGVQGWNGTACLLHEFGRNLLSDLVYASQADVLLGLHHDSLYWAFFMTKYSSVVEIRPLGFAGPQANQHMKEVTQADGGSILWWGIDVVDPTHSAPGLLETQGRGLPQYWARDRHVFMRLMACQYILERIALTRGNPDVYAQFKQRRQHHITDMLEPANAAGVYPTKVGVVASPVTGRAAMAAAAQPVAGQQAAAQAAPPSPALLQPATPPTAAQTASPVTKSIKVAH